MSIQDISVSNSQKKHLLKAINNEDIAQQEEDGSVIVHVESYLAAFPNMAESPVSVVIVDEEFNSSAEFWVFS